MKITLADGSIANVETEATEPTEGDTITKNGEPVENETLITSDGDELTTDRNGKVIKIEKSEEIRNKSKSITTMKNQSNSQKLMAALRRDEERLKARPEQEKRLVAYLKKKKEKMIPKKQEGLAEIASLIRQDAAEHKAKMKKVSDNMTAHLQARAKQMRKDIAQRIKSY